MDARRIARMAWTAVVAGLVGMYATAGRSQEPRFGPNPSPDGPQAVQPIAAPSWYPLAPKHQEHVDAVLKYWEYSSARIERYQCNFTRWVYDLPLNEAGRPILDKAGNPAARQISQGIIKYMSPDKALYRSLRIWNFDPSKSDYVDVPAERHGDYWICDGQWVYEFDFPQKILRKIQLPPDVQGNAISKGPLPFLFRAKVEDIKARFWIRTDTPPDVDDEYHLEAVPKTQEDAAHFRSLWIIIDKKDYLPKTLVLLPRSNDGRNGHREQFVFEKRQVNMTFKDLLNELNLWKRDFYEPATPEGWTLLEEPYRGAPGSPPPATSANRTPPPSSARR